MHLIIELAVYSSMIPFPPEHHRHQRTSRGREQHMVLYYTYRYSLTLCRPLFPALIKRKTFSLCESWELSKNANHHTEERDFNTVHEAHHHPSTHPSRCQTQHAAILPDMNHSSSTGERKMRGTESSTNASDPRQWKEREDQRYGQQCVLVEE